MVTINMRDEKGFVLFSSYILQLIGHTTGTGEGVGHAFAYFSFLGHTFVRLRFFFFSHTGLVGLVSGSGLTVHAAHSDHSQSAAFPKEVM